MKARSLCIALVGLYCSAVYGIPTKIDTKAISWDIDFIDDHTIEIASGPNTHTTYLKELADTLELRLPTKTHYWKQIEDWGAAIDNLRKEDLKVARARLARGHHEGMRFTDSDEFAMRFKTELFSESCNQAKASAQALGEEVTRKTMRHEMEKYYKTPFLDYHSVLEQVFVSAGDAMRCHRDLLKAAVDSEFRDPSLSIAVPRLRMGAQRLFDINFEDYPQQEGGFLHSAPKSSVWRKIIPNVKMDRYGTDVNLIIGRMSVAFYSTCGGHNRIMELLFAVPLATMKIPFTLTVKAPLIAAGLGVRQVHNVKHYFSSDGSPIFLSDEDLYEMAHLNLLVPKIETSQAAGVPSMPEMNGFEAMRQGGRYNFGEGDPTILAAAKVGKQRLREVTKCDAADDVEGKRKALAQLFTYTMPMDVSQRKIEVTMPFHCEYGVNISLGDDVYFNTGCCLNDVAMIYIGSRVLFGPGVHIYTSIHPLSPEERNGTVGKEWAAAVTIGDDVWVGGRAVILPGVTVGEGATIGAGAVVTKNVAPRTVVAGNPAKVIRTLPPK